MPPLPADAAAAASRGADTALAFAIEAARTGLSHGVPPPREVRELFIRGLAQLIRSALAPRGGDPAFQAFVLQALDEQVAEYVRLGARRAANERAVRAAVDAIAHPGKLRAASAGPMRDALARLHDLTAAQAWPELGQAVQQALDLPAADEAPVRQALRALRAHPSLEGLRRMEALQDHAAVQRYRALGAQQGPAAGSAAAAAQGRALPPQVIYCCTAPADAQPQMLSAASQAMLLAEPASLAFADRLTRGAPPGDDALAPVWDALATAPRLRSALHQWDTARAVREAMLHPEDLLLACGLPLAQWAPSPSPSAEGREGNSPS